MQEIMTALITPFKKHDEIDFDALGYLVEEQISQGCDGLIVCGTTAEVPTLTRTEKVQILDFVIERAQHRVPIWYGCGSNCTRLAIENCLEVENRDIAGVLLVTPYYNRPTQQGLYEHFKKISQCIHHSIMLYNIPSRTGCTLECDTLLRLLDECPNIVALKHASKDLDLVKCVMKQYPKFRVYSGEDGYFVESFEAGAMGVVSVMSHMILPQMKSYIEGGCQDEELGNMLYECAEKTFCEASPSPVKYMLCRKGVCKNVLRLPMVPISYGKEFMLDAWMAENDTFLQGGMV
ncbi:4-hydroxy-tetrahydrodipicolinate synthase [Amedibacillus sp. YH-ame6]